MKIKNLKRILIILSILFLPCVFYLVLIQGKNHFKHLEIYGPKEAVANGDTIYHTIPSFSFLNQEGKTITEKDLDGKIFVANFFFATCPTICPKMNFNVKGVTDKYKEDQQVKFLSFTVDPEQDSVQALAAYAKAQGADNNQWWFLTGDKDAIYSIARDGFLVPAAGGKTAADFFHSQDLMLIDRDKRIRGIYDGLDEADVKKLCDEIDVLEREYKEKETN
ncbi:MAG: SCO family protein [Bacteroidota bacterium]